MANLYLRMAEMLAKHWRESGGLCPQKFVLSPAQRREYEESRRNLHGDLEVMVEPKHMGVSIEIADATSGVMITADGTEVSLT